MKINCLLIDDEPLALRVLVNHIGKIPWLSIVKTCTNPLEALEVLKSHKVDLVFLDIQMPELSGLDFLESLSSPPAVIFTTAYRQFAADAFDLDGLDYLVKPVSFPRFMKAVNKYIERFGPSADLPIPRHPDGDDRRFFFIKQGRKMVKLFTDEILYVESLKDYVQIFTPGHKFIYKARITNLEEELQEEQFIRIHKSYLVPLGKIESVSPTEITIAGIEIPVGRTYRQIVLKRLGIREGRGTRDEGRLK